MHGFYYGPLSSPEDDLDDSVFVSFPEEAIDVAMVTEVCTTSQPEADEILKPVNTCEIFTTGSSHGSDSNYFGSEDSQDTSSTISIPEDELETMNGTGFQADEIFSNDELGNTDLESLLSCDWSSYLHALGSAAEPNVKDELRSVIVSKRTKTKPEVNLKKRRTSEEDELYVPSHTANRRGRVASARQSSRIEKRQERNRLAARRCRQRRQEVTDALTNETEDLVRQGETLKTEIDRLQSELDELHGMLLTHDLLIRPGDGGCQERMSTMVLDNNLLFQNAKRLQLHLTNNMNTSPCQANYDKDYTNYLNKFA